MRLKSKLLYKKISPLRLQGAEIGFLGVGCFPSPVSVNIFFSFLWFLPQYFVCLPFRTRGTFFGSRVFSSDTLHGQHSISFLFCRAVPVLLFVISKTGGRAAGRGGEVEVEILKTMRQRSHGNKLIFRRSVHRAPFWYMIDVHYLFLIFLVSQ